MKYFWKTTAIYLTILLFPLVGADTSWYVSNELMQMLEESTEENVIHETYALKIDGEGETLYKNGNWVAHRFSVTENGKTEVTTRYETGLYEIYTYSDDLLQKITTGHDGTESTVLFSYDDGQLNERKEVTDGQMDTLVTYYRYEDGTLAATREIDRNGESYITLYSVKGNLTTLTRQNGEEVTITEVLPSGMMVEAYLSDGNAVNAYTAEYDEDGSLHLVESFGDEVQTSIYSSTGLLSELNIAYSDGRTSQITYDYDDKGVIVHSNRITYNDESERIERWYNNSVLKNETQWINDIPQKSTRYNSDETSVVTIFEEGHPYADVTYASDGKRIISIEYRKEQ